MRLDNVYNGSDSEAKRSFNSLLPMASSFKNDWKYVNAEHQITSLQLIPVHDPQRSLSYGLDSQGILISSQLVAVDFMPGFSANVINWDGTKPKFDDKHRAYDESAIYLMNTRDMINAEKAGAYDDPDYWTRTLNEELDGVSYSRKTHLNLQTISLTKTNDMTLSHLQPADNNKVQTIALVDSSMDSPQFEDQDPKVDNNFDWFLSQTMDEMHKDYVKNNDGYRIDDYLAERYQKGLLHHRGEVQTTIDSLNASEGNTSLSGKAEENRAKGKAPVRLANGSIAKPIENSEEASEAAKRDHVSGQKHVVSNEMNVSSNNHSIESANASNEAKRPNTVSPNAEVVNNEMNMMGPADKEANDNQRDKRDTPAQAENKARLIKSRHQHQRRQHQDEDQLGG